jgi:2-isopropylmalate synthase
MMVQLLDSTLREGEQTPGVQFTPDQKLEIADRLDAFGIDIIEAGHPAVSPEIRDVVRRVADLDLDAAILAHSRALRKDIDQVIDTGAEWIGIFYCVTEKSLSERFNTGRESAIARITDAISYAKDHGLTVRYTPEDSFRTEWDGLIEVCTAAVEAGADRISLADTVGCMTPSTINAFVKRFRREIPVQVPIHVHCHNDLGLATANSLAAVEAGASVVDVTVNGLGERAGITSLAELAVAYRMSHTNTEDPPGDLSQLPGLSELVGRYSGIPIHEQAPIVGEHAFSHNAGLHVSAVLKDPAHYESIPVELVGRSRRIVLDRMAGQDTVRHKLAEWGLHLDAHEFSRFHTYLTTLDDGKTSEARLRMIANQIASANDHTGTVPSSRSMTSRGAWGPGSTIGIASHGPLLL